MSDSPQRVEAEGEEDEGTTGQLFDTLLASVPEVGMELQEMSREAELLESLPTVTEEDGLSGQLYADLQTKYDKLGSFIRRAGDKVESFGVNQLRLMLKVNDKVSNALNFHRKVQNKKEFVGKDHQTLLAMLREEDREGKFRAATELGRIALEPSKAAGILNGGGLPPLVYSFLDAFDRGWTNLQVAIGRTVTHLAFVTAPTLPVYSSSFGCEVEAVLQAVVYFQNSTLGRVDQQCVVAQALANLSYCNARGGMSETSARHFRHVATPIVLKLCARDLTSTDATSKIGNVVQTGELKVIGVEVGGQTDENEQEESTYLQVETRCWAYVAMVYVLFGNSWGDVTDNINSIVPRLYEGLEDRDEEVVRHAANCTANLCSSMSNEKGASDKSGGYFRGYMEAKIVSSGMLTALVQLATSTDSATRRHVASALSSLAENRQIRRQIVEAGGLQALASLASLSIPSDVVWGANADVAASPIEHKKITSIRRNSKTPCTVCGKNICSCIRKAMSAGSARSDSGSDDIRAANSGTAKLGTECEGSVALPPSQLRAMQESANSTATQLSVAIAMELLAKDELYGLEVRKMIVCTSAVHSLLALINVASASVRYHAMKALSHLSETVETHNTLVDYLDRLLRSVEISNQTSKSLATIIANIATSGNSSNDPAVKAYKARIVCSGNILPVILTLAQDGIDINKASIGDGDNVQEDNYKSQEAKELHKQAIRALSGYLDILYARNSEPETTADTLAPPTPVLKRSASAPVPTSSERETRLTLDAVTSPVKGLTKPEFLDVLDILIVSLQSIHSDVRCEGYSALSHLAKEPKHHNKMVSLAGRYLISPLGADPLDHRLSECRKYIEATLVHLGFDPSSDIQLCQFDATLLENWHMINKRIKVQDKLEEKIRALLEDVWHHSPVPEPESETPPGQMTASEQERKGSPLQKSNSERSSFFSPSTSTSPPPQGKQANAHPRSESLLDVLFGTASSDLFQRTRRRSSTHETTSWNDYLRSNLAHDGSTLLPGLEKRALIEFVGYYPSLLQQRLLLFSPDSGPLDDFPHSRCIVMPKRDYYTFRYGDILQKTVERYYGIADIWSILFTRCDFSRRFAHHFCEALYRLPSVNFLTFYNSPNTPKPQAGEQFVQILSNLPPFVGWINFDNALHPEDLREMMIPLSRSGVSGIAIRNSNFSAVDMKPLFDILKHNTERPDVMASSKPIPARSGGGSIPAQPASPHNSTAPPSIMQVGSDGSVYPVEAPIRPGNGMSVVTSEGIVSDMVTSTAVAIERRGDTSPHMRPRKPSDPSPISPFASRDRKTTGDEAKVTMATIPPIMLENSFNLSGQNGVLRWLDVSGNNLGDKGAAELIGILAKYPSIVALDMSRNNIRNGHAFTKALCDDGSGLFDAKTSVLEALILSDNQLGARTCEIILKKLWHLACVKSEEEHGLLTLDLSMNVMQQACHSQAINDLILADGTLRDINFEACKLTKSCMEKLKVTITRNTTLHFLRLDGNEYDVKSMDNVHHILKENRMRWAQSVHQYDGKDEMETIPKARAFSGNDEPTAVATDGVVPASTGDSRGGKGVNDEARKPAGEQLLAVGKKKETDVTKEDDNNTLPILGVLFSAPLVYLDSVSGTIKPMSMLDFDLERMVVENVIRTSRRRIELMFEYASTKTLRNMVTLGYQALHFSGHGSPDSLAFEDDRGGLHIVPNRQLRSLCSAGSSASGKKHRGVKFVFVSACFSQSAGEAFVKAGIPHVVCVALNSDLLDRAAQTFTHAFYLSLAVGDTIQDAFDVGVEAVKAAPRMANPVNEGNKFLLLPPGGNHDVAIFSQAPKRAVKPKGLSRTYSGRQLTRTNSGSFGDYTKMLPSVPDNFLGRNVDMYIVMGYVKERRLVTILGPSGTGKSALAIATANYLDARQYFTDGVYFVRLDRVSAEGDQLESVILESLGYESTKRRRLVSAMKKKSILLVLDQLDSELAQSKSFRFLIHTLMDQTRANILFTSESKIGLGGETVHSLGPLAEEDSGRLFELRSNYQCREWLSLQKISKQRLGRVVYENCKGNPTKILDFARDIDEDGLKSKFSSTPTSKPGSVKLI